MKDYTLSEVKEHCREMFKKYGDLACDECYEESTVYELCLGSMPKDWPEIEPRDMIKLPCVQKNKWESDDESLNFATYDLIFRDDYGHIQVVHDFFDEAKAYAFLAQMKGGKNGD